MLVTLTSKKSTVFLMVHLSLWYTVQLHKHNCCFKEVCLMVMGYMVAQVWIRLGGCADLPSVFLVYEVITIAQNW